MHGSLTASTLFVYYLVLAGVLWEVVGGVGLADGRWVSWRALRRRVD